MISQTPKPPYYAVIFTSLKSKESDGYEKTAYRMVELAKTQAGFLGMESVRDANGFGITVSYWNGLENISHWKRNTEHLEAQQLGKENWYEDFKVRITKVEIDYEL